MPWPRIGLARAPYRRQISPGARLPELRRSSFSPDHPILKRSFLYYAHKLKKYYNFWSVLIAIALLTLLYLARAVPVDEPLGSDGRRTDHAAARRWHRTRPGDHSTRVVTVNAPASEVWQVGGPAWPGPRWLLQQRLAGKPGPSDIHNQNVIRPELAVSPGGRSDPRRRRGTLPRPGLADQSVPGRINVYLWGPVVVLPVDAQTSRLYTAHLRPGLFSLVAVHPKNVL